MSSVSIKYRTLPELLNYQLAQRPEQPLIFWGDEKITYQDFDRTTNQLARGLQELGIQKGDVVSLFTYNCPEFIYTWFALAKLGAVMGPINVAFKQEETQYIVNNSEAKAIVASPVLAEVVEDIKDQCPQLQHRIYLGDSPVDGSLVFNDLLEGKSGEPLEKVEVEPDDTISIIYTSGTTGKPKGVLLSHWNYITDTAMAAELLPLSSGEVIMMILPLFHVNAQVATVTAPIMAGGTIALLQMFNPALFWESVEKYRPVTFSSVPTILSVLLNDPQADETDLSSLRYVICGAAPLPVSLFHNFEEKFGLHILEGYGLTEGTCVSSLNPYYGMRKIGSIGLPLRGQQMVIMDEQGNIQPPNTYGEICIKGPNIMKGYYKRPEETKETIHEGGWLRTGDAGYMDEDGYFWIVDRIKEMIIRGGENIYPREIEEVLHYHPKVEEAAVIGHPDEKYGEIVKAVIVPKQGEEVEEEEIKEYCKEKLARYKVPSMVVIRKDLPKTQTGKVQKKILKEQENPES